MMATLPLMSQSEHEHYAKKILEERLAYQDELRRRVSMLTSEQEKDIQGALSNIAIKKLSDYGQWLKRLNLELTMRGL